MKTIVMTGSPKSAGFSTKAVFLSKLSDFDYQEGKMTKRDNEVDILVTNTPDSTTSKMKLAAELNIEIMTYEELAEAFDLEGDL